MPAERDNEIYHAPGKTIDISADVSKLPPGWKLEQSRGIWQAFDDKGQRVAATGSREGTIQQALSSLSTKERAQQRIGSALI